MATKEYAEKYTCASCAHYTFEGRSEKGKCDHFNSYYEASDHCKNHWEEAADWYRDERPVKGKSGPCYIATAIYGTYDCPEVWTLRRYRDHTLGATWYGRSFIRAYYAVSPTLVKWFGKTEWFRRLWKPVLDKKVAGLNRKGVENTPYSDLNWRNKI